MASQPLALVAKNPPANAGDRDVSSILGWEDPLEGCMEAHCSILARRIPWTEELDGLQFLGSQGVRSDLAHMRILLLTQHSFHKYFLKHLQGTILHARG